MRFLQLWSELTKFSEFVTPTRRDLSFRKWRDCFRLPVPLPVHTTPQAQTMSILQPPLPSTTFAANPLYSIEQIEITSPLFRDVLDLRAAAYRREKAGEADELDEYSLHFVACGDEGVVGALRVTCKKDGPLESDTHYPQWLFDEFSNQLCASSRMCVRPGHSGRTIPFDLARVAWSEVLTRGVRLDVSKVRGDAAPFYLRMGYLFLRGSVFAFDAWQTTCGLIAYPANSLHRGRYADLFAGIDHPFDLEPNLWRFESNYRAVRAEFKKSLTLEC